MLETWQARLRFSRSLGSSSSVQTGFLASKSRKFLLAYRGTMKCLEAEAAGVAAHHHQGDEELVVAVGALLHGEHEGEHVVPAVGAA